jgi:prepilin-type N-terminal cleavage/methylation domain-containing protein
MRKFLDRLAERMKSEDGFTLIELTVVLVIIGQLIAMSIPTFLGTRARAQDIGAKSSAARTITTGRIVFSDQASYLGATVAALGTAEPSLTFQNSTTASTGNKVVSTLAPDINTLIAAVWSPSGTCFFIKDVTTTGVSYGKAAASSQANCTAANAAFTTPW